MSRRKQVEMTDEEIRSFLRSAKTMTLVSNGKDGYPHAMPMWYAIDDDDQILMTTFRKSQKIHNIRRNPKVALLVESGIAYPELKSVLIKAEAEIIDDLEYTSETMFRVSVFRGDATPDQAQLVKQGAGSQAPKRVVIRFKPVRVLSWDHAKLQGIY